MGHTEPLLERHVGYDEPAASGVRVVHYARVFLLKRAHDFLAGHN